MYISMAVKHYMYRGMEYLLLSRGSGGTGSDQTTSIDIGTEYGV
jgi:hypothetical protein